MLHAWHPLVLTVLTAVASAVPAVAGKPNIVFLVTDDQDVELGSSDASVLPNLHALLAAHGTTFNRMYASVPVCCPSRSSLYSGQYQHNNHVIGNGLPTNCSSLAWQAGPETRSFATVLQAAGYATSYAGKYLNQYGDPAVGGTAHVPPGWTNWQGLVGNSVYYNYDLSNNGVTEHHGSVYPTDYLPNVRCARAEAARSCRRWRTSLSSPACRSTCRSF